MYLRVSGDELQRGHLHHHEGRREERVERDAEEEHPRDGRLLRARVKDKLAEQELKGGCRKDRYRVTRLVDH